MNTEDQKQHIDPASPAASTIPTPRRPLPDDVDRLMRLTPEQREQYEAWRFIRSIQLYWRRRERELRPPTLVLLGRAAFAVRRWFREGMGGGR